MKSPAPLTALPAVPALPTGPVPAVAAPPVELLEPAVPVSVPAVALLVPAVGGVVAVPALVTVVVAVPLAPSVGESFEPEQAAAVKQVAAKRVSTRMLVVRTMASNSSQIGRWMFPPELGSSAASWRPRARANAAAAQIDPRLSDYLMG
jgi:hypothetical protein